MKWEKTALGRLAAAQESNESEAESSYRFADGFLNILEGAIAGTVFYLKKIFNKHAVYLKQYRGRSIKSSIICGHVLRRLRFTPAGAEWSPPRVALQSRLAHFCPVLKNGIGGVSVSVTVWSLCVLLATCEDALRPGMDGWMDRPLLRR